MSRAEAIIFFTLLLPAMVGMVEARLRDRGSFGWIVSVGSAWAGGVALMIVVLLWGNLPFSEGRSVSTARVIALTYSSLLAGALAGLFIANRFR
jgi:hypothetical protein